GTRTAGVKPAAPQIVAELRSQAPGPVPAPAEVPSPAMRSEAVKRNKVAEAPAPTRLTDDKAKAVVAPPPPSAGMQALSTRKEEADAAAPAAAPSPPPASPMPAPVLAPKKD